MFDIDGHLDLGRLKGSAEQFQKAQNFVDSEVLRLCNPKVPFRDGALIGSGVRNTNVGSGMVMYNTPYARKWYYTDADFTGKPERGTQWFERMKSESKKDIKEGAMKVLKEGFGK